MGAGVVLRDQKDSEAHAGESNANRRMHFFSSFVFFSESTLQYGSLDTLAKPGQLG